MFESGEDLMRITPELYAGTKRRLHDELNRSHQHAEPDFRGQNLYLEQLYKNIRFAQALSGEQNISALRRSPPVTLKPSSACLPDRNDAQSGQGIRKSNNRNHYA